MVGFDEACKQLSGEARAPWPTRPGRVARVGYEYERKGVCHHLLRCAPLRGGRHVLVERKAIERDREQRRRLVLATASYRLYADAIAQRLGFDDVIATGSVIGLDERVHARILGKNCYGEEKMRMIADWVEKSGLLGKHGHVGFYSDHASDEPAFLWSDEPVAVNPHDRLARMANERGWAVEDWG